MTSKKFFFIVGIFFISANLISIKNAEAQLTVEQEIKTFTEQSQKVIAQIDKEIRELQSDFRTARVIVMRIDRLVANYDKEVEAASKYFINCNTAEAQYLTYKKNSDLERKFSRFVKRCKRKSLKIKNTIETDKLDLDKMLVRISNARKYATDQAIYLELLKSEKEFEIIRGRLILEMSETDDELDK